MMVNYLPRLSTDVYVAEVLRVLGDEPAARETIDELQRLQSASVNADPDDKQSWADAWFRAHLSRA